MKPQEMNHDLSKNDHEFFPVWLVREHVEEEIERSLTDDEWYNLVQNVGRELDRVDAEVVADAIEALRR